MKDSLQQELQKFELPTRTDFPLVGKVITTLGVVLSLLHIWFNTIATLPELWISAIHFAGFAIICALWYPAHGSLKKSRVALIADIGLVIAILAFAAHAWLQRVVEHQVFGMETVGAEILEKVGAGR